MVLLDKWLIIHFLSNWYPYNRKTNVKVLLASNLKILKSEKWSKSKIASEYTTLFRNDINKITIYPGHFCIHQQ